MKNSQCALCTYHASHIVDDPGAVFSDSRSGFSFCHEHLEMLVTWELAGCPSDHDESFAWLLMPSDEEVAWERAEMDREDALLGA